MKKVHLEIDHDVLDALTVENLKCMRETVIENLFNREHGDLQLAVFSTDKAEDVRQLKKLYKGFNRVIRYMSVPGSDDEES